MKCLKTNPILGILSTYRTQPCHKQVKMGNIIFYHNSINSNLRTTVLSRIMGSRRKCSLKASRLSSWIRLLAQVRESRKSSDHCHSCLIKVPPNLALNVTPSSKNYKVIPFPFNNTVLESLVITSGK
jgi:hypothetical protein